MPTIKILNAAGGDGVDYTTLATWEDFADGEAAADQWAECYGTGNLGIATLSGWVATPTDSVYPKIYAASGHEATSFTDGPLVESAVSSAHGISIGIAYAVIEGIRASLTNDGTTGRGGFNFSGVGSGIINRCVSGVLGSKYGVFIAVSAVTYPIEVRNCLCKAHGTPGNGFGIYVRASGDGQQFNIDNNTLIADVDEENNAFSIQENADGFSFTAILKNNVCINMEGGVCIVKNKTAGAGGTLSFTGSSNNASTDGTADSVIGGDDNQNNITLADEFTDYANDDWSLKRSGDLYRGGVAAANTESLNGVTRHSPPDIGAYETLSPASLASDPTGPVDFGTIEQDEEEPTEEFEITNSGEEDATSVSVSVPAGFAITQDLPATIDAGETETLIVKMNNVYAGSPAGNISITSSVAEVTVAISGEVTSLPGDGMYGNLQLYQIGGLY